MQRGWPGAQSGPSSSYKNGMYYENYTRVPITGANPTPDFASGLLTAENANITLTERSDVDGFCTVRGYYAKLYFAALAQ